MKKTVIIWTIILLVSAFLGGSCAAPTSAPIPSSPPAPPPPTIEGLTYTNSEFGFSVKHPKDWDVLEEYVGTAVFFGVPMVLEGTYMVNISVIVTQLPQKMTFEDFVRGGELADKKNMLNYNKVEEYDTTMGGVSANLQTISGTVKLAGEDLLLKDGVARLVKDKAGYVITYDVPEEFHDQYADCFQLVISTFKFQ